MLTRLVASAALLAALAGCSGGRSCDDLPASTERRDAARAAYLDLAREQAAGGPATATDVEQADDELHDLEREHSALEDVCGS